MEEIKEDPLIHTIMEQGVIPRENCAQIMHGKSRNERNVNLCLGRLLLEAKPEKWLEVTTEKLLNLHYVLQAQANGGLGGVIPDFHYIPVPGKENAERVLHPEERTARLARYDVHPTENEIATSPLGKAELSRSRELCWVIPYKSPYKATMGTRKLLFVLTFDPHHLINLRTNPEELERAKLYWETLATQQGKISPKDNPKPLFLHGLTGLHEWMEILFPPEGKERKEWIRHSIPDMERERAALMGLDLYYSNSTVVFGWSTLEKIKGRERSRTNLQQLLSKKVILFDPIYGKSTGQSVKKKEIRGQISHRTSKTEHEITAKAVWESAMLQAYHTGGSDIHLEPQEEAGTNEPNLIISLRKDGEINFFAKCKAEVGKNVIRYALESSGVTRSETERDQDGRKTWIHPTEKKTVDLRISVTPSKETMQEVVIRLLDSGRLKYGLGELGLETEELEVWRRALSLEESLILVSGPTGSGKSSSLFAAICDIHNRNPKSKITSIEDPIEYIFPFRATQHEVKEKIGMTFPTYIRRMLRNDADTVLVGEIRDKETLFAALQLGLTGHRILSTIHAKSAADTALRMLEFQPEPYIVSEVTKLIVAQRLVKLPCPVCSHILSPTEAEEDIQRHGGLSRVLGYSDRWKKKYPHIGDGRWKKSTGCPTCQFSGVQGKTALQEFLIINEGNKKYLKEGNVDALQASMREREFYNLETNAWKMAWLGRISIKEAGRLTNRLEES